MKSVSVTQPHGRGTEPNNEFRVMNFHQDSKAI